MKKIVIRTLTVFILLLILSVLLYGVMFYRLTRTMAPLPTQKLGENVYSVKDSFVNLYLIRGNKSFIAVDAGNDVKIIDAEIKKLGINKKDIAAILLTHSDSDHVAATDYFGNAKIYCSKDEEQMVNGKTHRFLVFDNRISRKYTTVEDNQALDIDGIKIKCLMTPGHTPGSMCFLINDRLLFTGDNLRLENGRAEIFSTFVNMDSELQKKSLMKLSHVAGVRSIYTAHHGSTDNFGKAFENWKKMKYTSGNIGYMPVAKLAGGRESADDFRM